MQAILDSLLLTVTVIVTVTAYGEEPSFVFDNRPETGVPREARTQVQSESNRNSAELKEFRARLTAQERRLFDKSQIKLHEITEGTIKTVRIRYFNKETWATEEQAREYVRGFLAHKSLDAFGFQIWSQAVQVPEIECLIDFTDEHRKELGEEQKLCSEGRLLIWKTESCFRSATGRWWYVVASDHFHSSHPKGNRKLAR